MKLFDVVDRFLLISPDSETVGFHYTEYGLAATPSCCLSWVGDGEEHDHFFDDQDIMLTPGARGYFYVVDLNGKTLQFQAVESVDLEKPDALL